MPELPEVETIRRELMPLVVGQRIADAQVHWPGTVRQASPDEFVGSIRGKTVTGLSRRGKFLVFRLSGGRFMALHLKMTGSLLALQNPPPPDKHTRLILTLEGTGGSRSLHFRDPRKFGGVWIVQNIDSLTGHLGPEPLTRHFTSQALTGVLEGRRQPIKVLLCDQTRIAGIGNMYADEALFEARLHPRKPAAELTPGEITALHRAIRRVLRRGIEGYGASVSTYRRPDGSPGRAHEGFRVAHRLGYPCLRCGMPIERISLRGRGTYYCPRCQPS